MKTLRLAAWMRVLAVAMMPVMGWGQDHVFVGSLNPQRIDVYRSATGAVNDTQSSAMGPVAFLNNRRPLHAVKNSNGESLVGIGEAGGSPTVFTVGYDTLNGTATGPSVTVPVPGANIMVLNRQKTEAFLGINSPTLSSPAYTFQKISRMNIQGIPNSLGALTSVISLDSDCYDMDVHPVTGHLIAACYGVIPQTYEILDIDPDPTLPTKTVYSLAPYVYFGGTLRIEPTQGNFAYLTGGWDANGQSAPKILSISFSGGGIAFSGEITTPALRPQGYPSQIAFHPSGKWAYVPMFSSPGSVIVLDTNLGLQPATTVSSTKTYYFSPSQTLYQSIASNDRFYVVGLTGNNSTAAYFMNVFDIDSQGALTLSSDPQIAYAGVVGLNGIARIEEAQSMIVAKVDPAVGPPVAVSLDGLPAAQSTSLVVPGGTALPLDAGNQVQPPNAPVTGPQYSFLYWAKNTTCATSWDPLAAVMSSQVPQGQTDTYCACYEKQWYVSLNVLGSCSATALNGIPVSNGGGIWIKDSTTVTGTGTGGIVTVSPATGVVADGPGKSITVKCDPGPLCSPAGNRASLAGWWAFEGNTPVHDDRRGTDNYLDRGTSTTGQGYVNQAAFFGTVPINSNASARTTDAAAEVNFNGESFTIDAWIKYEPAPTGFRSIVDKFGGPDAGGGYAFFVNDGNLMLAIVPAGQSSSAARSWSTTGVNVSNNAWRHVAVVVSRTSVPVFYVDGLPVNSAVTPAMFGPTVDLRSPMPLNVGGFNFAGSTTNGGIDELEIFNEALPAAVIKEIADAKQTGKCLVDNNGCVPPPTGMTGWYTFDEAAGPTSNDRAGTNVTATWKNAPTSLPVGRVARGITLGGTNHLEVNSATEYNAGAGDLSIDAWVNWNGASGVQTIVDKRQLVAGNNQRIRGYLFFIQNGQLGFQLANASADGVTCTSDNTNSTCTNWVVPSTGTLVPANSWTHVAVTVNRNGTGTTAGTFYVNGAAVSGFAAAIRTGSLDNTQPLLMGRNTISGGGFAGALDELEIFIGRVVPAAEIYGIFAAGPAGKCKESTCADITTTSWVGWWRFEEPDTQFTASDQMGNVNNFISPVSRVPGKFGKAMRAINLGGAATIDSAPELNAGTGDLTVDAWIWVDPSANPLRPILSKKFDEGYALWLENGALRLDLRGVGGVDQTWRTTATVPNSQWVFVAARLTRGNPGAVALFINSGTPQALATTGTIPTGSLDNVIALRVGATPTFGDPRVFGGNIDEIEIFKRALTNAELNDIATRPDGKCDKSTSPCVAPLQEMQSWHRFEEATGPFFNTISTGGPATVAGTVTRGPGKIGNAVGFTNHIAGSLEVNPATTVAFGNRSMSIDFWIKATPIGTTGTRPVVDKMTGVGSTPNTGYKVDLVNNKVVFTLASFPNLAAWTSTNDAATGAWVHVAITTTGSSVPIIYLNGVPETLLAPVAAMITGSISNTAPLRIGSTSMIIPASTTLETQFELDELELFSVSLTRAQVEALAVSNIGKCVPAPGVVFPVTVNTNLNPVQGVPVGINNIGSGTDTYTGPSVPAGNQQVFAPATKIDNNNANVQWTFINWSFNGTPNPTWTNPTQTVPVSAPGGTYTANYQAWYWLNVVNNGPCASNLASGFYPFPNPLVINVGGGGTPIISYQGPTLSGGTAPPLDTVANNTALPINFPGGTVTITCGALVPVTVNTNPAGIGATVGILTLGTATNVYTNPNVPNGSANLTANALVTNNNQDTEWRFKNWSINNVVQPSLATASPQPVIIPNTAVTYTANYDTWYKLTVNVTGPCAVSHQTGFYLAGTSLIYGVFATGGGTITTLTATRPGNLVTNLTVVGGNNSSSTILMNTPVVINAVCSGPGINVTVNTNPANLGVTVGIASGTTLNLHNATLPPSSVQTVTNTPPSILANNTLYGFVNWSPSGPSVTLPATGSATYTANYNISGYVVTATGCGVTLSGAIPVQSGPAVYPAGATLTATANPSSGQSFQNFQVTIGGIPTTVSTNPASFTLTGPATITANCLTSFTTTGAFDSDPSGFLMRVGSAGDFLPTPFTRSVTLNQPVTVTAQTPQMRNGTGYQFAIWSNGAASAVTTFTPTATPVNLTATYRLACHVVTATVSPSTGGTISASARSLTGFPDGCYAPGTRVTFAVTPAMGQAVTRWTGVEATGNSATVTVNGPLTITAITGAAPAPNLAFEYVSRSGLSITLRVRNLGTGTATAARLTSITGTSAGVGYASPALPATLGDIVAGGTANVTLVFTAAAANQGFSFTAQGSAQNQAAFSNVITVPLQTAPALQLNALSRTNGTNTITLVFEVRNVGTATATNIITFLALQNAANSLQLNSASQSLADLAPGAAQTVTYTILAGPGANTALGSFNGQLFVNFDASQVTRAWHFQAPTTIIPL